MASSGSHTRQSVRIGSRNTDLRLSGRQSQASHNSGHPKRQRRHKQSTRHGQQLWPLSTSVEAIVKLLPGGSAWLRSIDADKEARLHFFQYLHKFYNHPLMRLSSANKERATILSIYIEKLKHEITGDTGSLTSHNGSTPFQPANMTFSPTSGSLRRRRKHRKSIYSEPDRALTRENLEMLDGDAEPTTRAPPQAPSKVVKLHSTRQPSKAYMQKKSEEFKRKSRSQTEEEAMHLKKRSGKARG